MITAGVLADDTKFQIQYVCFECHVTAVCVCKVGAIVTHMFVYLHKWHAHYREVASCSLIPCLWFLFESLVWGLGLGSGQGWETILSLSFPMLWIWKPVMGCTWSTHLRREPSSSNHALNTSTQTPRRRPVRVLCSPAGGTRCFHFLGTLTPRPSFALTPWWGLFHTTALSYAHTTGVESGVISPLSVLDQDETSWDFK